MTPWWQGRTIEDTQRSVAEALRRTEEMERTEALLTLSQRLALRRQELEELDSSQVSHHPLRGTMDLCHRVCRGFLIDEVRDHERQIVLSSRYGSMKGQPARLFNSAAEQPRLVSCRGM